LQKATIYDVNLLSSILLLSEKNGGYRLLDLPIEAQFSPIYSFLVLDVDNDGIDDLLAGGNQYLVKPQFGRYDASHGWFFKGRSAGNDFSFEAGVDLNIDGQIRDIEYVDVKESRYILFSKYDSEIEIFKVKRGSSIHL
jgi:enediyne biosynthesis protein E4